MFCEKQTAILSQISKKGENVVVCFDATGSLIKGSPRTFLYMLVAKTYLPKVNGLPLLQWLTDSHDSISICTNCPFWELTTRKLIPKIDIVICDFSFALLHAASEAFNKIPLKKQIIAQWRMMCGEKINCTILRLCANHKMKSVANKIFKMNLKKKVLTRMKKILNISLRLKPFLKLQ